MGRTRNTKRVAGAGTRKKTGEGRNAKKRQRDSDEFEERDSHRSRNDDMEEAILDAQMENGKDKEEASVVSEGIKFGNDHFKELIRSPPTEEKVTSVATVILDELAFDLQVAVTSHFRSNRRLYESAAPQFLERLMEVLSLATVTLPPATPPPPRPTNDGGRVLRLNVPPSAAPSPTLDTNQMELAKAVAGIVIAETRAASNDNALQTKKTQTPKQRKEYSTQDGQKFSDLLSQYLHRRKELIFDSVRAARYYLFAFPSTVLLPESYCARKSRAACPGHEQLL